jgi:hypothetical protein
MGKENLFPFCARKTVLSDGGKQLNATRSQKHGKNEYIHVGNDAFAEEK